MSKRKKWIKNIAIYVVLLFVYVLSLTLITAIPNNLVKKNIEKSARELLEKGEKSTFISFNNKITLFNFTDAMMLNIIYSTENEKPLTTVLLARRNYIKGVTEEIYKDTNPPGEETVGADNYNSYTYQTKELWETVNGRNTYHCIEYARYWHGYMIILKPLLFIFDYQQIQLLSLILIGILSIILIYLIIKKIGTKESIAFFLGFVLIDLYICSLSINLIISFYIAIISSIILLLGYNENKDYSLFFLIIGSLTSFFELLVTPLITLGIPFIIKVLLDDKKEKILLDTLKLSICWGIGYATTMISKWIFTDILLNREVFITSFKQFLYRIGNDSEGTHYTLLLALQQNLCYLGNINIILFILLLLLIIIIFPCKYKEKNNEKTIALGIIALFPFLWFGFLKNHSTVHAFFTYRNLALTLICLLLLLFSVLQKERRE